MIDKGNPTTWRERMQAGERCVRFELCYSLLIATIRRQSPVLITRSPLDRYLRGLLYSVIALLLGPWGIPWGPIWTARAVWVNLTGGEDVTDDLLATESDFPATE